MNLLVIFLIGFVASFFGSFMSGGLAAITLTLLMAFGIPPHVAIGTFNVGGLGYDLGGLWQFIKNKKVQWRFVPPLSALALVGGFIGSYIVLQIPETLVAKLVGLAVIAMVPVFMLNPALGTARKRTSKLKLGLGFVVASILYMYVTSIGIGYGLFAVTSAMYFFGFTLLEAKATGKLPILFSSLAATIVFGVSGVVDWQAAAVLAVSMFIGASVGTHFAIKLGDAWLRRILLIVIMALSAKLILGF